MAAVKGNIPPVTSPECPRTTVSFKVGKGSVIKAVRLKHTGGYREGDHSDVTTSDEGTIVFEIESRPMPEQLTEILHDILGEVIGEAQVQEISDLSIMRALKSSMR